MNNDKRLRVAVAQCSIEWQQTMANIASAIKIIDKADVDLVVLPEMFATGFAVSSTSIAQGVDGVIVASMREKSVQSGKAIIFSAAIVEDERCFNRLFFVTPDGAMAHYDKRHLFRMGGEQEHYTAGVERLVVEYKGFRICPLVCYDLRFPVFSRNEEQYDVLVYIASWPTVRIDAWSTLLRARAIENLSYCIGANRVGSDPDNTYCGDSVILNYKGAPLQSAAKNREQIITHTLSLNELGAFRRSFAAHLDADNFMLL